MTIHSIGVAGSSLPVASTVMEDLIRALQEKRPVDAYIGEIFAAEWHYYIKTHCSPLSVALANGQFVSFRKILASLEEKKLLKQILEWEKFDDEDVRGYRSLSEGFLAVEGPLLAYFGEMVAKRLVAAALVSPLAFVQPPYCVAVTDKKSGTCFFASFDLLDRAALNERIKDILFTALVAHVYKTPTISVVGRVDQAKVAREMLVGTTPSFEVVRSLELLQEDDPTKAILEEQLIRKPEAFRKMALAVAAWAHRREAMAIWHARAAATVHLSAHVSP